MPTTANSDADDSFEIIVDPAESDSIIDSATRDELQKSVRVKRKTGESRREFIRGIEPGNNILTVTPDGRAQVPGSLFPAPEPILETGNGSDKTVTFKELDKINVNPQARVLIQVEALPATTHKGVDVTARRATEVDVLIRELTGDAEVSIWFFLPATSDQGSEASQEDT